LETGTPKAFDRRGDLRSELLGGAANGTGSDREAPRDFFVSKYAKDARIPDEDLRLAVVEPRDDLVDRQSGGRVDDANHAAPHDGGSGARRVDGCRGAHDPDRKSALRGSTRREQSGHAGAQDREIHVGERVPAEDEHATPSRAAARGQAEILPGKQLGLLSDRREVPFHSCKGESSIGHDIIEMLHQEGLRHHRQRRQIFESEAIGIHAGEPSRVERGVLNGVRQQAT
jgi:hypothetical protein